jgi:hypothetical protein
MTVLWRYRLLSSETLQLFDYAINDTFLHGTIDKASSTRATQRSVRRHRSSLRFMADTDSSAFSLLLHCYRENDD